MYSAAAAPGCGRAPTRRGAHWDVQTRSAASDGAAQGPCAGSRTAPAARALWHCDPGQGSENAPALIRISCTRDASTFIASAGEAPQQSSLARNMRMSARLRPAALLRRSGAGA